MQLSKISPKAEMFFILSFSAAFDCLVQQNQRERDTTCVLWFRDLVLVINIVIFVQAQLKRFHDS